MTQQSIHSTQIITGTEVTLQELIALRMQAWRLSLDRNKKWPFLSGQKFTCIRGRGIEYDSTREYQPGDDIRSMAWRVTARNMKPHIKIYHEEKEQPIWLALDLSPSLYFGTRCMFKSVKIIEQAALKGWASLLKRERIGAIIQTGKQSWFYQAQLGESNYLNILNSFVAFSKLRPSFSEGNYLRDLLLFLQKIHTGHVLSIYSDFFHFDADIQKLIFHLSQRMHIILNFVYDIIEAEPPPPHSYILTDGQQNVLFNMNHAQDRKDYQKQFQVKIQQLTEFSHHHPITLRILTTDSKSKI